MGVSGDDVRSLRADYGCMNVLLVGTIEPTLAKAPLISMVPMIGSLGCPYTCSFCIDSTVPYQPLSFAQLRDDLKFLLPKIKNPIVSAIISMAGALGMQTIAEGVETEGQLAFLREQGCDECQGYLFSKPLPPVEFERFVRESLSR